MENTVEKQLFEFTSRGYSHAMTPMNRWLEDPSIRVYVRRGYRLLGEQSLGSRLATVLDIANVEASARGQGRFTKFLDYVERNEPFEGVFIENVLDLRLANFFLRRGYTDIKLHYLLPVSLYRLWR